MQNTMDGEETKTPQSTLKCQLYAKYYGQLRN